MVFHFYRDKKYDEALGLIKNQNDIYSIFLRSQIFLAKSMLSFLTLNRGTKDSL